MGFNSYTDIFGGSPVQPSNVAYSLIDLTEDLVLNWPQSYLDSPNLVTRFMSVTESEADWRLLLPDATQVSVGQDFLIVNVGEFDFILCDNNNDELYTVAPNDALYYILTDNSTTEGIWQSIAFGVGTSGADAVALAGYGLLAFDNKLNTNLDINTLSNINNPYTISDTDRASLIVWIGGVGTFNLPDPAVVEDGFYFSINNQGEGQITLVPFADETIDVNLINPTNSLTLATDGTNWFSLGYGQTPSKQIGINSLDVSASIDVTLTAEEAQALEQFFTGTLTANITVTFPATANFWFVANQTTGSNMGIPYTLGVLVDGGTPFDIPQGGRQIIYTDGTNMYPIPEGIPILLPDGSAALPSLTFQNDQTTGAYLINTGTPANNTLGFTVGGTAALEITNTNIVAAPTHTFLGQTGTIASLNHAYSFAGNATTSLNYTTDDTPSLNLSLAGTNQVTVSTALTSILNNASIAGNLGVIGTLGVTGATTLSTLGTSGLATLNSASVTTTLGVTGAVTLTVPLAITDGGTGQITAAAAFNALSPITTEGDLIVGTGVDTAGRLAAGTMGQYLQANGPSTLPSWANFPIFGKVLQVEQFVYADTTATLPGTATFNPIPGFQVTITPTSATSKILVLAQVYGAITTGYMGLTVGRGANFGVFVSAPRAGCSAYSAVVTSTSLVGIPLMFLDDPATTSLVTYSIGAAAVTGIGTINYTDGQGSGGMAVSSITVMEIGA